MHIATSGPSRPTATPFGLRDALEELRLAALAAGAHLLRIHHPIAGDVLIAPDVADEGDALELGVRAATALYVERTTGWFA